MDDEAIKSKLRSVALHAIDEGPGYAQEDFVLRTVAKDLDAGELSVQQRILTAWHELFRNGELAWGYNLDNPSHPFFHRAV